MKHFLPFLIFLVSFSSFAQNSTPIDKKSGHIIYTGLIDAKGVSQAELYLRMKAFYNTYGAGENAMQLVTDDTGRLSGKAFTDIIVDDGTTTEKQRLGYTLTLELEDGKLRYEMTDFRMQRYCIPARPVACELQTKLVAAEAILKSTKKGKKKVSTNSYAPENALEKTTSSMVTAMKESALAEHRIANTRNQ
ncbi:DUF4468 domain-containing protein [Pontibacter sp. JH31]|uniref:DUF4468 domain-containing protein n=1 Tax=Pontibacter aquaedesilientis TaxID=2766980 RepID=A0ABR7XEM3_9BACT|nr:DUF4468 domain-containing protein [Pontibacter aquaedesilientis]MBD1396743.1 DUF4468 domain-containing protein [Pontibacter aquaedesilientis]